MAEKELQKAKDFIKGKMVMGMEASDEVAMFFVGQELSRREILKREEIFYFVFLVAAGLMILRHLKKVSFAL